MTRKQIDRIKSGRWSSLTDKQMEELCTLALEALELREEVAELRKASRRVDEIKKMLEDTRAHVPFSCSRCNSSMDSIRQLVAENGEMREQQDALLEDKERLDWMLKTLYEGGWDRLMSRLRWEICCDPKREDIDAARNGEPR